MGKEYKTFLRVPGSFFLHGWQWFFCSWAVPGGLWGHESGHVYDAPNIIFKPYRALPLYPRTEPHCRLPCQTSAENICLNSIATCAIMVQTWFQGCLVRSGREHRWGPAGTSIHHQTVAAEVRQGTGTQQHKAEEGGEGGGEGEDNSHKI